MRRPDDARRAAVVAVHDVSPATWHECRQLIDRLDAAGVRPLTLLIVPDFHHRAPVASDRAFVRAMDARLARGDELVLHGLFHLDEAPAPRTPRDFVRRRLMTRAEGEFAALPAGDAAARLALGIALFDALEWPLHGFVPPAWLTSDGARAALAARADRFDYVTARSGIHYLPQWHFEPTANLCYSPWNAPRRLYSRLAIRRELARAKRIPLLRLSLHPQDARVPAVLAHWERLAGDAMATRSIVTKREWAARFKAAAPRSPPGAPSADAASAQPDAAASAAT
jgi:predicted deacetylase